MLFRGQDNSASGRVRRPRARLTLALLAMPLVAFCTGCGSSGSSSDTASGPIPVGFVTSFTGPYAGFFATLKQGFAAAIAQQNAQGGINGRKIVVYNADDASTAPSALSAVRQLVLQHKIFALASGSALLESAVPFLKSEEVPVVGLYGEDGGTEWGPTGDFVSLQGSTPSSGTPPSAKSMGVFYKREGTTNLGIVSANAESNVQQAKSLHAAMLSVGVKNTYTNVSIPSTQLSGFGGIVQNMHSQGVNGLITGDPAGMPGLLQALNSAGLRTSMKAIISGSPLSADVGTAAGRALVKGVWTYSEFVQATAKTPAAAKFRAAMVKYEHATPAEFGPIAVQGWLIAQGMIQGLKDASKNLTRPTFLSDLRHTTNFTGGGMEIAPVNLTTSQGTSAQFAIYPKGCMWFAQYEGTGLVAQPKPVCAGMTR